jgi:hypothetical protein
MEMAKSKVYVQTNVSEHIVRIDGGYTIGNITEPNDWVLIDEGNGDRYNLCQTKYLPKSVITSGGAYRYKLVDGKPVECTPEEIAEQEEANKPKTIAPYNITEGEYVTVNGTLYKATVNIPNGTPIVTGQNAVVTTVEEQLYELTRGE